MESIKKIRASLPKKLGKPALSRVVIFAVPVRLKDRQAYTDLKWILDAKSQLLSSC